MGLGGYSFIFIKNHNCIQSFSKIHLPRPGIEPANNKKNTLRIFILLKIDVQHVYVV